MKFAERYEIQEMVTSGRVSTFLARDRNSQEPVVVYTFEVTGTSAAELSTASIISRFSSLAPSPPGIIVKAGFDQASSSAFLTTRMPDQAALQKWVAAYHSFGKTTPPAAPAAQKSASTGPSDETAELSAADLRAFLAQSNAQKTAQRPASPPAKTESSDSITEIFGLETPATAAQPQSPGEFTRLFRELNAFEPVRSTKPLASPNPTSTTDASFGQRLGGSPLGRTEPAPPAPAAPSGTESPGAFTREFLGLSSTPAEPPQSSTAVDKPVANEPSAFTREFLAASSPTSEPTTGKVPPAAPPSIFGSAFGPEPSRSTPPTSFEAQAPQKESTGEFTRYFQDPFEHPGTQQNVPAVPDLASVEPPKQQAGDFTRMFGKIGTEPEPLPVTEPKPTAAEAGSFTQIFEQGAAQQGSRLGMSTLGTNPNFQPTFPEPVKTPPPAPPRTAVPVVPPSPASPTAALDELLATPSARVPESNATFMNRPASNTTNVFNPGADAPPVEDMPKGPSEFTMFVNRSQLNAMLRQTPGAPAPPPGGQVTAPPPIPNPFMAPTPPPRPPVMAAPPMPAMPPVPRPPSPPVLGAPKANSMWPLITGLTILFAIGVILVMYFVLKH
jgi:hypothetical protein